MSHPRIRTGAVLVVLVAGASCSDDNDAAPATTSPRIEPATTPAPDPATAAEEVARGFLDALVTNDADRAISYLTESAIAAVPYWGSPEGFRRDTAWNEAARFKMIINSCERRGDTEAGTVVRCGFDLHALGSDAVGIGPFGDNYWDLTVRDGKIVSVPDWTLAVQTNGMSSQIWAPFASWIRTEHPDDVLVMYTTADQTFGRSTEDATRLWEQRTQEYVQLVLARRDAYPGEVGAICATQAAQLGELAVPAEGALDQVAAWNTAAAAIIDQAHEALTALDKPPSTDTQVYTNFYGRLARLVRIAEESAQAASSGDATRLTELNAEYLEVRQAMNSGPTGSGLEACLASLPA